MANPNKYEIGAQYVSYNGDASIPYDVTKAKGSQHVGKAVMHTGDGTVGLVTDGNEIAGKLIAVEPDGVVTVQYAGFCDLPTDASTITFTKTNNGLVGGGVDGTVKSAGSAEAAGAVRCAKAIQGDGTNRIIAQFLG